jgi:hypothetical protein
MEYKDIEKVRIEISKIQIGSLVTSETGFVRFEFF